MSLSFDFRGVAVPALLLANVAFAANASGTPQWGWTGKSAGPDKSSTPAAAAPSAAQAAPAAPAPKAVVAAAPDSAPPFYRGSSISYRNTFALIGLNAAAEPTHNPYYGMQLSLAPRAWLNDKLYARASFDIATELTRADWTNDRFFIGDLGLGFGADGLYKIPFVDVIVSPEVSLSLPTSLASRASTRVLSTSASVGLSRAFGKLALSAFGNFDKYWNRETTGSPTGRLLGACEPGLGSSCADIIIQTGRRNADFALSTGLGASYKATKWMSFSLSMGVSTAFLYPLVDAPEISLEVKDTTDVRYVFLSSASVSFRPTDELTVGVGFRSAYGQLAPDGSYRIPFFNRFTQMSVDLAVNVAALVQKLRS